MSKNKRVNVQELYDWVVSTIENYGKRYGELVYQNEWIPMPDYFFKYKNDKIFSSGVQISYDNEFFCFGIVSDEYVEPMSFCSIENLMNNDAVFQKELGLMLEELLNRQLDSPENSYWVMMIKKSIIEAVKENTPSCHYEITDYLSYSEKQEEQLLKEIYKFEPFEASKKNKKKILKEVNKNTDKNINKSAGEVYEQKYSELRALFYSPDTEKYPEQEIINPGSLKIKPESLKKGKTLVINDIRYTIGEDVIFKNHKEDFIESSSGKDLDIKVTHRGQVSLYRESDNNLYSMDVYVKEEKDKKGKNIYYVDDLVEEQLYIHNVTVNLPEDNRPLTRKSYFTDSRFEEIYKEYDSEKAYKREDFKNYLKEISNTTRIDEEVLNAFKNEFKDNKDLLLKDDFDIRKWSDGIIYINYGLNLSSEKSEPGLRKRKM